MVRATLSCAKPAPMRHSGSALSSHRAQLTPDADAAPPAPRRSRHPVGSVIAPPGEHPHAVAVAAGNEAMAVDLISIAQAGREEAGEGGEWGETASAWQLNERQLISEICKLL